MTDLAQAADNQDRTSHQDRSQAPRVLVVCQTIDAACRRVRDELLLVGLKVHVQRGNQDVVSAELEAAWDAIVLVNDDGSQVIWAHRAAPPSTEESIAPKPVELRPAAGESSDSVALRSAELVRAELHPQNATASGAAPSKNLPPPGTRPSFALATGPALLSSSYGGATIGWTADISYWFEQFSLGLFATGALSKSPWQPAQAELDQQQLTAGILTKGLLLRSSDERLDLMLGGGVGARTQWFSSRPPAGPKNEEQFHGVGWALAIQLQLEASYAVYPWLGIGGALGGTLGVPLSFPAPTAALKKKATDELTKANQAKNLDELVQLSVLVTFRF